MKFKKGDAVLYDDEVCFIAEQNERVIFLCDNEGFIFDHIHRGDSFLLEYIPELEPLPIEDIVVFERVYNPKVYKINEDTLIVDGVRYIKDKDADN